jgi:hypothetical protein
MRVRYGFCVGHESLRWLIETDDGRYVGCRRTEVEALRFLELQRHLPQPTRSNT